MFCAPGNGNDPRQADHALLRPRDLIPHAIYEDGQIIVSIPSTTGPWSMTSSRPSRRRARSPLAEGFATHGIVGGELDDGQFEQRHDPRSNINELPLQMKSNWLPPDHDFGAAVPHRAGPIAQSLDRAAGNEARLPDAAQRQETGAPDQLVIFSTNLEPRDLVDEAFLRRIPYKIEIGDPSEDEFRGLFEIYSRTFGCEYRREVIDDLLARHFRHPGRRFRRCYARDLRCCRSAASCN